MSSLIFIPDEQCIQIATDTLANDEKTNTPLFFTTKAFVLPHLKMAMAGTGVGGFLDAWFFTLNTDSSLNISDIDSNLPSVQSTLRYLWNSKLSIAIPDGVTTTVYHFCYSLANNRIRIFAFRSAYDFAPEELDLNIKAKPETTIPYNEDTYSWIIDAMNNQREIQSVKNEPIGIGGEIQVITLSLDQYFIETIYCFCGYGSIHSLPR